MAPPGVRGSCPVLAAASIACKMGLRVAEACGKTAPAGVRGSLCGLHGLGLHGLESCVNLESASAAGQTQVSFKYSPPASPSGSAAASPRCRPWPFAVLLFTHTTTHTHTQHTVTHRQLLLQCQQLLHRGVDLGLCRCVGFRRLLGRFDLGALGRHLRFNLCVCGGGDARVGVNAWV